MEPSLQSGHRRKRMQIGYLVPQFPGQTHIFFWRELRALVSAGITADIISTSRPPQGIVTHTWSQEAAERTTYLTETFARSLLPIITEIIRSGPSGWIRCLRAIQSTRDESRVRQIGLFLFGAALASRARQQGWHHVHVHSCGDSANIAMFAALLSGLRYSLTLHGPLRDYGGNHAQKWGYASFGIVITKQLLEEVRSELGHDAPKRISVCPMGVDISVFSRKKPYEPACKTGTLRIFSCGRLNPCKGHVDLIDVVAALRGDGVDAQLEIAGEDEQGGSGYRQELAALIKSRGLSDYVTLAGAVPEEHVRQSLDTCHVFALLSIAEPLGVAIMEAMAMEVPVVITSSGGVAELVTDGRDGILVPPKDRRATAEAIKSMATDGEKAFRLGVAARSTIINQFQSKRSAEAIIWELQGIPSQAKQ